MRWKDLLNQRRRETITSVLEATVIPASVASRCRDPSPLPGLRLPPTLLTAQARINHAERATRWRWRSRFPCIVTGKHPALPAVEVSPSLPSETDARECPAGTCLLPLSDDADRHVWRAAGGKCRGNTMHVTPRSKRPTRETI